MLVSMVEPQHLKMLNTNKIEDGEEDDQVDNYLSNKHGNTLTLESFYRAQQQAQSAPIDSGPSKSQTYPQNVFPFVNVPASVTSPCTPSSVSPTMLMTMVQSMPFLFPHLLVPNKVNQIASSLQAPHYQNQTTSGYENVLNNLLTQQQASNNRTKTLAMPKPFNSSNKFSIDAILNGSNHVSDAHHHRFHPHPKEENGKSVECEHAPLSLESLNDNDRLIFNWLQASQYNTSEALSKPSPMNVETLEGPKSSPSPRCNSTPAAGSSSPSSKRKSLNRGPRIPFTTNQVGELESKFAATQYLSSMEVSQLAKRLNLTDTRIRIWFQNRRAREKREHRTTNTTSNANETIQDDNGGRKVETLTANHIEELSSSSSSSLLEDAPAIKLIAKDLRFDS